MLDHVGIVVHDVARSRAFYEAALAPLGYRVVMEAGDDGKGHPTHVAFGTEMPEFWVGIGHKSTCSLHVAFIAKDRAAVKAFYDAALAAGARDAGAPALRPKYHPDYYGAFVFDPDGVNVEAVCHLPE